MNLCGIIMAAGSGSRMKMPKNKVFLKFGDSSALARCIKVHKSSGIFDELIIVCRKEEKKIVEDTVRRYAGGIPCRIVEGGKERQDSVCNALAVIGDDVDYISVHDAARCFVTEDIIKSCASAAVKYGSAIPVSPVTDTVKIVDGDIAVKTLNRNELRLVQTPQIFEAKLLIDAYEAAYADGFYGTDDASLVERLGKKVHVVTGSKDNIKLTTKEDIEKGRAMTEAENGGLRIGNGFDVHAFTEGRKLILGGVDIPYDKGLDGHSDADVLIHAVMDALLGASRLPDIGELFPPGAAQYKDISSLVLLQRVKAKMDERYCEVVNIDVTLMLQTPKISPYKEQMIANIAEILKISRNAVNIKATTTEHLGFIGRKEGVCASCVCLVKQR